eukprot:SAG31_NODE_239_length_19453_cov_5.539888_8_plen_86_part_00
MAKELLAKFYSFNKQYHPGPPVGSDQDGYCAAAGAHKGFMVPWRQAPAGPDHSVHDDFAAGKPTGDPMEMMTEADQATFMAGGGM